MSIPSLERYTSNSSTSSENEEVAKITSLSRATSVNSTEMMARSSVTSMSSTETPQPMEFDFKSPEPEMASTPKSTDWDKLYTDYVHLFYQLTQGKVTDEKNWKDLEQMQSLLETAPTKFDLEPSFHPILSPKIKHSVAPLNSTRSSAHPDIFAKSGNEKKSKNKCKNRE